MEDIKEDTRYDEMQQAAGADFADPQASGSLIRLVWMTEDAFFKYHPDLTHIDYVDRQHPDNIYEFIELELERIYGADFADHAAGKSILVIPAGPDCPVPAGGMDKYDPEGTLMTPSLSDEEALALLAEYDMNTVNNIYSIPVVMTADEDRVFLTKKAQNAVKALIDARFPDSRVFLPGYITDATNVFTYQEDLIKMAREGSIFRCSPADEVLRSVRVPGRKNVFFIPFVVSTDIETTVFRFDSMFKDPSGDHRQELLLRGHAFLGSRSDQDDLEEILDRSPAISNARAAMIIHNIDMALDTQSDLLNSNADNVFNIAPPEKM